MMTRLTLLLVLALSFVPAYVPAACTGLTGDTLSRCLYDDLDARLRKVEPSPPPSPSPTPTSPSPSPAESWLSGASGPQAADGTFGTWRGAKVEIAGTWLNSTDLWTLRPGAELGDWTGPLEVAGNAPDWRGWAAEASGTHDAYWRTFARNLAQYRAGRGTTYLRIYHEYNGDWMDWSVTAADRANFVTAWERTAKIIRSEFPQVKMMLGSASAGGGSRINVADAWPDGVDVLSIDWYNQWNWCATVACFNDKIENGAGANSLADLQRLAAAKKVPIIISEWGNAGLVRPASAGGGGEAPAVIAAFHDWLADHAGSGSGQVIADIYFNIDGYDARFELFPTTVQPLTAAAYRVAFRVT